jgi:hypothetical protein
MAIIDIKLGIDDIYIKILHQALMMLSTTLFFILLEDNNFTPMTFFLYNILGLLFYHLVLEQIIMIR